MKELRSASLYFWRGMVFVVMLTLATIGLKRTGSSNAAILFQTSWLLLPFCLRPLIAPWMRRAGHMRFFILSMELMTVVAAAGITFTQGTEGWKASSLAFLWLMAACNAIHDIAADELFMQRPPEERPSFMGVMQTVAVQLAMLIGAGVLVMVAGNMEVITRQVRPSWTLVFRITTVIFLLLLMLHVAILPDGRNRNAWHEPIRDTYYSFIDRVASAMKRASIWPGLLFVMLFMAPEMVLLRGATLFMLDPGSAGGLGLSPQELALVKGSAGVFAFTAGFVAGRSMPWSRRPLLPLWTLAVLCLAAPNLFYLYLSFHPHTALSTVCLLVAIEQLGAGFASAAYIHFLIDYCNRRRGLSYTACVSVATLSLLVAGLFSGYLMTQKGYRRYFLAVCLLSVASLVVAVLLACTHGKDMKGEAE